jgi:TIR domain
MSLRSRLRRFFGVDVFISHSHQDAGEYAIALAARLSRRLAVYVDRYDSEPGDVLSDRVRNALRSATMLVVVASPEAATSQPIADEIAEFRKTGRSILVIDAGDALRDCRWRGEVVGLSHVSESLDALQAGRPDRNVVRSILAAFRYVTRARRLWRSAAAAAAVVVLAVIAAIVIIRLARSDVRVQREAAEEQRSIASARQITNAARSAWDSREEAPDTVLLLAAESLRRSFTPEAIQLIAELTPLVPRLEWQTAQAFPKESLVAADDGRWLFEVPAMGEPGVRVLDAGTGATIFRDERCSLTSELPPPGMIALSCPDGTALVDPQRKALAGKLPSTPGVRSVASGTNRLVIQVNDNTLELRDRRHPQQPGQTIAFSGRSFGSVALSRDDGTLAVERSGELQIFDVHGKPRAVGRPFRIPASVYQLVLSDDGSEIVLATGVVGLTQRPASALIYLRRAQSGIEQRWTLPLGPTAIPTVGITDGGVMFGDGTVVSIRSRDADAHERLRILSSGPISSSRVRVFTNDRGSIRAWHVPRENDANETAFALSSDGKHALLRQGRILAVRDLSTGRDLVRRELGADFQPIGDLSADGGTAAIALLPGMSGHIASATQIFDTRTGTARNGPEDLITMAVAVSPDGTLVASAGVAPGGIIHVLTAAKGKEVDTFVAPGMTHRLAFSEDNATLIGIDIYYALWKRDLRQKKTVVIGSAGGKRQTQPGGGGAALVAMPPDGTFAIVATRGWVERWPLRENAAPEWRFPLEEVSSVDLARDAKELAVTTAKPSRLIVYDAATQQSRFALALPFLAADVVLPPGTRDPVVIGMDGLPHTIYREARSAALSVCRAVGRSLSPDEWKRLIHEPYVDTCAELSHR